MFRDMSSSERRKGFWTDQDILDAHRLLRVLDERSKQKAAERLQASAQIAEGGRATVPGSEPISFEANGCARPVTPDEAVGEDRARNRHSGGLK